MEIVVNGAPRTVEEDCTVERLLTALELNRPGVAVAVDRRVVPRSHHATTALSPGARVEVIRAVGGG